MLEKIFTSHKKWINTTIKFGCSKEEAEDILLYISNFTDYILTNEK